jgi:hypothetical protein
MGDRAVLFVFKVALFVLCLMEPGATANVTRALSSCACTLSITQVYTRG